ncbi:MAG: hypothetical protein HOL98_13680 [Gammaproteobacteria bacterium]|nr:hypothetical protein [Gammaproteobacteria bacterium]
MANILFTWEIGRGDGHIAPYIKLINQLEKNNHSVYFAARELDSASRLFASTQVNWLQAPLPVSHRTTQKARYSYVEVLQGLGYERLEELSSLIKAWLNLFTLVDPDLIIFDYSPTAILASRGYRRENASRPKTLRIGTGFHSPPFTNPIPSYRSMLGMNHDPADLIANEAKMLSLINKALTANGITEIDQVADMQRTQAHILRTFRELDHYQSRENAVYSGIFKSPGGIQPEWPDYPGPKIFIYTKPFPALHDFLLSLRSRKYPTLVYGDGLGKQLMDQCGSEMLKFSQSPLDMNAIGDTADIAICNANHGTSSELLLKGLPILMLPRNAEQHLVAQNVIKLGAGILAPWITLEPPWRN